jgi:hypothetical protein
VRHGITDNEFTRLDCCRGRDTHWPLAAPTVLTFTLRGIFPGLSKAPTLEFPALEFTHSV